jgi:glycosyltransferase involved in cell wall biosynthesis
MHTTIIMPAYNTAGYIVEAMQSVVDQTYKDWDLVVIDDGSTDNTASNVFSFMASHPSHRIAMYTLPQNGGVARATRIGIEKAVGPLVTVLDSDDRLDKNSLKTVVPLFDADPSLGYAWSKFRCMSGQPGWSRKYPSNEKSLFDALLNGWWAGSNQRWLRKSAYNKSRKMQDDPRTCSDLQVALVMSATGCKVKHVPKITYYYRSDGDKRRISVGQRRRQVAESQVLLERAKKWRKS